MWSVTYLAFPTSEVFRWWDLTHDALLVLWQGKDQKRTVCTWIFFPNKSKHHQCVHPNYCTHFYKTAWPLCSLSHLLYKHLKHYKRLISQGIEPT